MTYLTLAAIIGIMFGLLDLSWIVLAVLIAGIVAITIYEALKTPDKSTPPPEHHHVTVVRHPPYDWERDQ